LTIKRPHKSAAVHQGAGAVKLIARIAPAPPATTNTTVWQYPTTILLPNNTELVFNPSNYWWSIEASSDLAHWSVVISNATGPGEIRVKRTDPHGFFRLEGRLSP
jgi:hypothetical protein